MDVRYWLIGCVMGLTLAYRLADRCARRRRLRNSLRAFPSPPTLPLIGNIHLVFGNGRGRVKKLLNMFVNYESPFVVWLAHMPMVVLTKGEHIQTVSGRCVDRDVMGIFEESVGDGIVVARADKWRQTRRILNPAFHASMLRRYLTVFNQQSRLLVETLAEAADTGRQFDLWPCMANANVDIITENITGNKLNTQRNRGNEFSDALVSTLKLESVRLLLPWLLSPALFYLYRLLTGNKDVFKKLRQLPQRVLREKKLERERGRRSTNAGPTETDTLVDMLFDARETHPQFDEKQIHDEMLNIIVTGSESTAVTGSFVLLLLAMHPRIQDRVYEEVASALGARQAAASGDDGRGETWATMEILNRLVYLEQCVKETLRIFTLFPLTLRKTTDPIKLDDGRTIPPHCQVVMALHGVHLDPRLYPEPTVWNPDNFCGAAVRNRPKHSFLAFGAGPRSCIGAKYAMMSLKTQIASLVLEYRLETTVNYADLRPVMDAIVRNQFGYPVALRSRRRGDGAASPAKAPATPSSGGDDGGGARIVMLECAAAAAAVVRSSSQTDNPENSIPLRHPRRRESDTAALRGVRGSAGWRWGR